MMLRKIAVAAASKPTVEIKQDGDHFYIKTSTTMRTTEIDFKIGEEFEEQTVDRKPCKVSAGKRGLSELCPLLPKLSIGHFPGSSRFLSAFSQRSKFPGRMGIEWGGARLGVLGCPVLAHSATCCCRAW